MIRVTGAAIVEQPSRVTRRLIGGREVMRSWRGTREAVNAMEDQAWTEGATAVDIQQNPGDAAAIIQASYIIPQDGQDPGSVIEEVITVSYADQPIPIHRHPNFIGISSARIQALEKEVEKSSPTAPSDATELRYYNLRMRGVRDYRADFPVIHFRMMVPPNFNQPLDVLSQGKIYTAAQVVAFLGAPILFTIPTANVGTTTHGDYYTGYKYSASAELASNGGWHLMEFYEWGMWETDLYTVG